MGKGRPPLAPRDFMLRPPPEREMAPAEMESVLDVLFRVAPSAAAPVRDTQQD